MQSILVCAQDPVLAKKVRFLMERDECKVEILASSDELASRLDRAPPTLLVLSRQLRGKDAIALADDLQSPQGTPDILVLGGETIETKPSVHLVPDPVDTTTIYREASRLLQSRVAAPTNGSEDPILAENARPDEPRLEDPPAADAFEAETTLGASPATPSPAIPAAATVREPRPDAPADAEDLDPAGLARAFHRAWSREEDVVLVLDRPEERLSVRFLGGKPIEVRSDDPGDPLGRDLVERGRLSRDRYGAAAIHAIERGISLAAAIVELGLSSRSELDAERGTTAREQLVRCFAGSGGRFWTQPPEAPGGEPAFALDVGQIIARGLRTHADASVVDAILGEALSDGYFALERPSHELQRDYPLSEADLAFLEYERRAYNVEDAADGAGLPLSEARRLLALLVVCGEASAYTPTAKEFEDRIREERKTRRELESRLPASGAPAPFPAPAAAQSSGSSSPGAPRTLASSMPPPFTPEQNGTAGVAGGWGAPSVPPAEPASPRSAEPSSPPPFPLEPTAFDAPAPGGTAFEPLDEPPGEDEPVAIDVPPEALEPPVGARGPATTLDGPEASVPAPRAVREETETPAAALPTPSLQPPLRKSDPNVPPMPVPPEGEGVEPRMLSFAKPLPRGPDGGLLDVPERAMSREHFQSGVALLGKGNFSSAEEHFRDAVALCAEEHVYLIGLARAIYYNPTYRADGKIPVLRTIVERAKQLAPDDKRVCTLESWVVNAETLHGV